jgi:hypothetical protein
VIPQAGPELGEGSRGEPARRRRGRTRRHGAEPRGAYARSHPTGPRRGARPPRSPRQPGARIARLLPGRSPARPLHHRPRAMRRRQEVEVGPQAEPGPAEADVRRVRPHPRPCAAGPAGGGPPGVRLLPGGALRQSPRIPRGPQPGGAGRPAARHRPLRPRPRRAVHHLRLGHHHGRAQAPLSRPHVGRAGPAAGAGAVPHDGRGGRRADPRGRPRWPSCPSTPASTRTTSSRPSKPGPRTGWRRSTHRSATTKEASSSEFTTPASPPSSSTTP